MDITKIIREFDSFLRERNQTFEAVIIGGAALNLLSITSRVTRDVDVLDPTDLPEVILKYARDFAQKASSPKDWLNNGPADVLKYLPRGWEVRTREVFNASCLKLRTLSETELLMTKCWAYCDRERDYDNIIAMKPSTSQIEEITRWLKTLDGNPDWPAFVEERMQELFSKTERE